MEKDHPVSVGGREGLKRESLDLIDLILMSLKISFWDLTCPEQKEEQEEKATEISQTCLCHRPSNTHH